MGGGVSEQDTISENTGAKHYRKKPVVIEAVQLRWDTWSEVCAFVNDEGVRGVFLPPITPCSAISASGKTLVSVRSSTP